MKFSRKDISFCLTQEYNIEEPGRQCWGNNPAVFLLWDVCEQEEMTPWEEDSVSLCGLEKALVRGWFSLNTP